MQQVYTHTGAFRLESGYVLTQWHLRYTTLGTLNKSGTNAVWVFHALTANSDPAEWWPGLVGKGKFFDPEHYFIVCVNMPGSCYGSISPLDIDPATGMPFYHDFPWFTTRDMIRAYQKLRIHLGVQKIAFGLGGSMGGQQLLEWAVEEPQLFEVIVPIATNAQHSPWGIAFNATQRRCIEQDPTWLHKTAGAGTEGMKTARAIALLSYRQYETYRLTQQGYADPDTYTFRAETYQQYQGEKLAKRFNALSYYFLSKSMDAHDIGRDRGSIIAALKRIQAKALVISISSDLLFPASEQELLARHIPDASWTVIESFYGHDGFLLEFERIEKVLQSLQAHKTEKVF